MNPKLTLRAVGWSGEGRNLANANPIQFTVDGLPPGHESILIGQKFNVSPPRWQVLRTRAGVTQWCEDYETPEAALQALQVEFDGRLP